MSIPNAAKDLEIKVEMSAAKILVLIQAKIPFDMHAEIQVAKIQAERILRARERVSRLFYRKPDFTMIPCNMKAFHKYYPLVLHMMAFISQNMLTMCISNLTSSCQKSRLTLLSVRQM